MVTNKPIVDAYQDKLFFRHVLDMKRGDGSFFGEIIGTDCKGTDLEITLGSLFQRRQSGEYLKNQDRVVFNVPIITMARLYYVGRDRLTYIFEFVPWQGQGLYRGIIYPREVRTIDYITNIHEQLRGI